MNKKLSDILFDIYRGVYRLPAVDKHLQWTQVRRMDLLHSIHDGIPIGGITVLLTGMEIEVRDDLTPSPLKDPIRPLHEYVLDGHNRLHTLYSVFGSGAVARRLRNGSEPLTGDKSGVCFNCKTDMFTDDLSSLDPLIPAEDFLNPHKMIKHVRGLDRDQMSCHKLERAVYAIESCLMDVVQFASNDRGLAQTSFTRMSRGEGGLVFL